MSSEKKSNESSKSANKIKAGTVRETLNKLLKVIKKVDYKKIAELESQGNLGEKHYLVYTIDKLKEEAEANNWGLCNNNNKIYVFNGAYWQLLDESDLLYFLEHAAKKMGVEILDAKYYLFKDKLLKQFISSAYLPVPTIDKGVTLINLSNGTFEITPERRKLRKFDKKDFLKYQLPFEYDPKAKCPKFDKYLNRVLPDKELQKILAEFIGYVFTSTENLKLEKTVLIVGPGGNGKSVLFDVLKALFGKENITHYTLESLTKDNGYCRVNISDKILNYSSEISDKLNVDIFKQLVSGEPVEARQIYGKPHIIEDYAKLMFNCNELPTPKQRNEAYFRRFIIIPFKVKIPKDEQNSGLAQEIISEELPGVFNWVLEGLERLLENSGFTESEAANQMLKKYRTKKDSVRLFLEKYKLAPGGDQKVTLEKLLNVYTDFCTAEKLKFLGKNKFSSMLNDFGFQKGRDSNGTFFYIKKKKN